MPSARRRISTASSLTEHHPRRASRHPAPAAASSSSAATAEVSIVAALRPAVAEHAVEEQEAGAALVHAEQQRGRLRRAVSGRHGVRVSWYQIHAASVAKPICGPPGRRAGTPTHRGGRSARRRRPLSTAFEIPPPARPRSPSAGAAGSACARVLAHLDADVALAHLCTRPPRSVAGAEEAVEHEGRRGSWRCGGRAVQVALASVFQRSCRDQNLAISCFASRFVPPTRRSARWLWGPLSNSAAEPSSEMEGAPSCPTRSDHRTTALKCSPVRDSKRG